MKSIIPGLVATAVLLGAVGVTDAHAEASAPWWGVSYNVRPANLQAGNAKSQVVEITIGENAATSLTVGDTNVGTVGTGAAALLLKLPQANAANVQADLEQGYGPGNVEVTEVTGGPAGQTTLIATSIGRDANRPVPVTEAHLLINASNSRLVTQGQGDGQIVVMAENLGDGDANGSAAPVRISDTLPSGLKAVNVEGVAGPPADSKEGSLLGKDGPVRCPSEPEGQRTVTCTFTGTLPAYDSIELRISVIVEPTASSGEEDEMTVSGGGAAESRTVTRPVPLGGTPRFGLEEATFTSEEVGGAVDRGAGSHPFQLTSVVTFNQTAGGEAQPIALPKDVSVLAPPGLVGNPTPFARCTDQQFSTVFQENGGELNLCPTSSAIGVAVVTYDEPSAVKLRTVVAPVFNMVPNTGEPARFGFFVTRVPVLLNTSVRTGSDYGVTVSSHNIVQIAGLLSVKVTLWGVPGDPRHNAQRGWACLLRTSACKPESQESEATPPPFLSLPTSCTGPLQASVQVDSWAAPKESLSFGMSEPVAGLNGCNHLPFAPEIAVVPDVSDGSTPTGLTVDVHVPQTAALNAQGLAESTLRNTTVTLPEGVSINPGGADGLEACSEGETGFLGKEAGEPALNLFTPLLPDPFCPAQAKIGTVVIHTPLLPNPLEGAVYLASPAPAGESGQNPFDSLVAMYMVAEDPVSGVLVKLPGEVAPNPVTSQLTSTFEDTPQLPFEELELHFFGGSRAPLATPAACGSYTTQASFAPWSGNVAARAASTFQVTSGPNGSPCASPLPFHPEFQAGTTNIQAGAFTPLTTTMGHPDGNQVLGGLSMKLPPGLLGSLAKVKLCEEPRAAEGTCGPESLIGHTVVTAGLGSTPAVVRRPGNVYITGPYKGAPYGLSIVNPAEAGPFDLEKGTSCDCVVVRAKIEVDPHTAQLTITSDPLPTIIKGIPLLLQHVNVSVERPEFTFNPTNCSAMKIEGSMQSGAGASVPIATPFQVANCASLPFKPGFKAATKAKHSRKDGAKLEVLVTSGAGHANIAKAHVELPKKLPSRLSTLQQACTEAQFEANPAGCPAASEVGSVVVHTPVLPVPLTGPAYFVSHGGAKFPELIMVLQGYGITVDLAGETFISKKGITSTTLDAVPDVPFDSFKLTLPEGPHSALAGNGDLCGKPLIMPVQLTGQNGALVEQSTKVKVRGCATSRKKHKHKAKKHKGNGKGARGKRRHASRRGAASAASPTPGG